MHFPQGRNKVIETGISFFLLSVILFIAIGVFFKQFRYEAGHFISDSMVVSTADITENNAELADLSNILSAEFKAMNTTETYDPNSLYEKINGKADLYLVSGFVHLTCQRFVNKANDKLWWELFVYDMGSPKNAFAVFGAQRRYEAKPLDWTRFSYSTKNAVFLARGRYYIEAVAADESEHLLTSIVAAIKHFIEQRAIKEEQIEELAYFPDRYLIPHSINLIVANVFGFSELRNTFTARYELDGEALTAFISKQANRQTASSIFEKYYSFLIANGGEDKTDGDFSIPAKVVDFYGSTEIVFTNGEYIAGVHEADSEQSAKKLTILLNDNLSKAGR